MSRQKISAAWKKIFIMIIFFTSMPLCFAASVSVNTTTTDQQQSTSLILAAEKNLVSFVERTVDSLRYSVYKLGGKKFDTTRGVYILDCSNFVDNILQQVSPNAYSSLVNASGADSPASQNYYEFFKELTGTPDSYWNKVDDIEKLRPGDILVFRYKNRRGIQTGGHVMIVMDAPMHDDNIYFVRVADSAPSAHSQDTRDPNTSGIGIGTLLIKANSNTGRPSAYSWGIGGYWNKNVNFAMARPKDPHLLNESNNS